MRDAAAVFALCESCAALLVALFDSTQLFDLPAMAVGCLVGAIVAACLAPIFHSLSLSSQPNARIKLLACGSCVGVASVVGIAAAHEWLFGSTSVLEWLKSSQLPLTAWVSILLPTGAWLFIIAGAVAAHVFGRVACTQTA